MASSEFGDFWRPAALLCFVAILILIIVIIVIIVAKKGAQGDTGPTGSTGVTGSPGQTTSSDIELVFVWQGAAADIDGELALTRIGNSVTLFVDSTANWVATTTGNNSMQTPVGLIPLLWRATSTSVSTLQAFVNGVAVVGLVTVDTTGTVTIAPNINGLGWAQSTTLNGWNAFTVSYLI